LIEKQTGSYSLSKDEEKLVFRTANFIAGRGSVLHSGVYNREFSSWLASFTFAGVSYFFLVMSFGKEMAFYAIFMVLFIGTFPLFRKFVFREQFLETVLYRTEAKAVIIRHGIRKKVLETIPMADITGLRIDTQKTEIVNRDGVEFVQKISAQHNTVIPGFGEETIFFCLKLRRADGTDRTIFAERSMPDVLSVYDDLKEFLKIGNCSEG
jgi:membrane protein YdbS with pleckstrin-like domain